MLELANNTMATGNIYSGFDHAAKAQFTAVLKCSFSFTADGSIERIAAAPLQDIDEWRDKPHFSSLKSSSEIMPFKQGSEILLQGTVIPPENKYHVMDVSLILQTENIIREKFLRLFGSRQWQRHGLKYQKTHPTLLAPIALIYENAFGGVCPYRPEQSYPENPAGKGFLTREKDCDKITLPTIEYANHLLEKPSQQITPAGFGPIPLQWAPRLPTFKKEQFKSLEGGRYPEDLKLPLNFYNVAPFDQRFTQKLIGGEIVKLRGLIKNIDISKTVEFKIPSIKFHAELSSGINLKPDFLCDTLIIDIDAQEFHLVWRAAIPAVLIKKTTWLLVEETN